MGPGVSNRRSFWWSSCQKWGVGQILHLILLPLELMSNDPCSGEGLCKDTGSIESVGTVIHSSEISALIIKYSQQRSTRFSLDGLNYLCGSSTLKASSTYVWAPVLQLWRLAFKVSYPFRMGYQCTVIKTKNRSLHLKTHDALQCRIHQHLVYHVLGFHSKGMAKKQCAMCWSNVQ